MRCLNLITYKDRDTLPRMALLEVHDKGAIALVGKIHSPKATSSCLQRSVSGARVLPSLRVAHPTILFPSVSLSLSLRLSLRASLYSSVPLSLPPSLHPSEGRWENFLRIYHCLERVTARRVAQPSSVYQEKESCRERLEG